MQACCARTRPLPSDRSPQELQEILPKAGLVVSEKGNLSEVLCKVGERAVFAVALPPPQLPPVASSTLQRLHPAHPARHARTGH